MHGLQGLIDERTDLLLQMKKRKVTPDLGWPFYLVPIDEVAYFSATVGTPAQQKEFNACNRDVVARGRAPGRQRGRAGSEDQGGCGRAVEAARSPMEGLGDLNAIGFANSVGLGVYDVHSPWVAGSEEIAQSLRIALKAVPAQRLWVNLTAG